MKIARLNRKKMAFVAAGLVWGLCCWAESASAQGGAAQYTPNRPTFSPYFGYFQTNTTGLPNYYAFVRPQQQLQEMVQRQSYQAGRTGRVQQQQQGRRIQLRSTTEGLTVRQEGARRRSTAATFMNHSHYYSSPSPSRRGR